MLVSEKASFQMSHILIRSVAFLSLEGTGNRNQIIVSSRVRVQEKSEKDLWFLKCSVKSSQPLPPSVILA